MSGVMSRRLVDKEASFLSAISHFAAILLSPDLETMNVSFVTVTVTATAIDIMQSETGRIAYHLFTIDTSALP